MSEGLTGTVLVPVATEEDMQHTAAAIHDWIHDEVDAIHLLHVIEKAGGAVDKAPLELREEQAEAIFQLGRNILQEVDADVEPELRYATDILDEIQATAQEIDATAIVFSPRPGSRLTRLLSGNLTPKLVMRSPIPVIVLPARNNDQHSTSE